MLNNLLIYRLIIVNLIGAALLAYAESRGWVAAIIHGDSTGVIWVVVGAFVLFQLSLWNRAAKVGRNLNLLKLGRSLAINPVKFAEKAAHLDDMPGWIMLIGLIGNVLGIMMAIGAANLGGSDAGQSITNLLGSMDVAFGATITSGLLGIWADIMRRILRTATVCMLEDAHLAQPPAITETDEAAAA